MLESQTTAHVLMLRPASFQLNSETAATNAFQQLSSSTVEPTKAAQHEFDLLSHALRTAGVSVYEFADTLDPATPDALFPNNWVSFHSDSRVVLYPMLAKNRRQERRPDILDALKANFAVGKIEDLTPNETRGRYLEGTGSLVLDRVNRIAYAAISPRTHSTALAEFGQKIGYEIVTCTAVDEQGVPIYHTNVMMSIGTRFAVVCTESLAPADRPKVLDSIAASSREIIEISQEQTANFAGNVLELQTKLGSSIVAMSERAKHAFSADQLTRLERLAGPIISSPIPTIEQLGGGSVRCMIAEIHLPLRSKY